MQAFSRKIFDDVDMKAHPVERFKGLSRSPAFTIFDWRYSHMGRDKFGS